jgi:F-type H+-transporting ATPase subunit a
MSSTNLLAALPYIGKISISGSVITSWGLMLFLAVISWISARMLRETPGNYQIGLEGVVSTMENTIESVLPGKSGLVFPFIATLWIFILLANLTGIVPGLHSPTSDLSVTSSLAVLVFFSVHWFGVRSEGLKSYLKHYVTPSPILLPFHLISEVSRTLALAVRLFGNVMSLEIGYALILLVAGFLVPVPLLMLHLVEAVIQAYLFGMLALIYIAGGIQAQELRREKERGAI